MPILNYTTEVNAIKTALEIEKILVGHGAMSVQRDYDSQGLLQALFFVVPAPWGDMQVRVPVDAVAVLRVLEKQRIPSKYRTKEQAVRVAWRIAKTWVEAQMAILEYEMVKLDQVFLPYVVMQDNKTLYDTFVEKKGLISNRRPLMITEGVEAEK